MYTDSEVEVLFAKKLAEKSLMQFELNRTPPKEQGPIVMLLDSSGSMSSGDADVWAAAVCLAFLEIAHKQRRAFAIVHFGDSVLRVDEFKAGNAEVERIIEAVSFFAADGGTNFVKPLDKAVEIINKNSTFTDADIVMITDGQSGVGEKWLSGWWKSKLELGFDCYSILVGNHISMRINELFSDEVVHLNEVLKSDEDMHKFFGRV